MPKLLHLPPGRRSQGAPDNPVGRSGPDRRNSHPTAGVTARRAAAPYHATDGTNISFNDQSTTGPTYDEPCDPAATP